MTYGVIYTTIHFAMSSLVKHRIGIQFLAHPIRAQVYDLAVFSYDFISWEYGNQEQVYANVTIICKKLHFIDINMSKKLLREQRNEEQAEFGGYVYRSVDS